MKSRRKISHIVVHTSASYDKRAGKVLHPTVAAIRSWHKGRGWSDIGYHFVIDEKGEVHIGRGIDRSGAHVAGFNSSTIGICVTGHGDYEDFNPAQKKALANLTADLLESNGLLKTFMANPMRVIGHREVGPLRNVLSEFIRGFLNLSSKYSIPHPRKTCPGMKVDMSEVRRSVLREIEHRLANGL